MIVVAGLCLASLACGGPAGDGGREPEQPPAATVPASTPVPTQSGPPLIRSSIQGTCRLTATGAQMEVTYSATAFGSTSLSRVRLLQDGKEADDSGELDQRSFQRVKTLKAEPGEQHTFRVAAESPLGAGPNAQTTVRCGTEPTTTPGPRA
jgi:hypothetical protein